MSERPSPSRALGAGPSLSRSAGEGQRRPAWLLLGGAFGAFTLSAALMHSYPVYLVAFIAEFGWSRAETLIAYSVSQLVAGASSPLVGYLVDRLGSRRLLLLGGGLLVAGLVGSAFVATLWQIIVLYGIVMTFGANCLGLVVFVPMLSRYFVRRRGMAISIVQSANGIARGISAPLVQLLISLIGWRSTYLVQAGLMGVFGAAVGGLVPSRRRLAATAAERRSARRCAYRRAGADGTRLDIARGDAHPAFLAVVRGVSLHRARQLFRVAAPARLCRRYRLRQAPMPPKCSARARFSRYPALS